LVKAYDYRDYKYFELFKKLFYAVYGSPMEDYVKKMDSETANSYTRWKYHLDQMNTKIKTAEEFISGFGVAVDSMITVRDGLSVGWMESASGKFRIMAIESDGNGSFTKPLVETKVRIREACAPYMAKLITQIGKDLDQHLEKVEKDEAARELREKLGAEEK